MSRRLKFFFVFLLCALLSGTVAALEDVPEDYNRPDSNPWEYESGVEVISSGLTLAYTDLETLMDSDTDFTDGTHHSDSVEVDFFGSVAEFISHFTMNFSNDNLTGKGSTSVPEPATMFLLGTGLIGLAGLGRKFRRMIK